MIISKIIENVKNFNFFNNELIIEKKDDTICKGNESFKFKGESYTILENNCIGDIQEEYADIYNLNFEHLVRIEKQGIIAVSIIDKEIYSVRWEDENENDFFSIYKNKNEIKVRDHFYGKYLDAKYRITFNSYNRKEIFFYKEILSDNYLWHYQLPEGFKIFGSVQAIDDVLFFISYKESRYQLVTGLDLETGNILYQNQYEVTIDNKFIVADKLNKSNGLLYGFGPMYQILNPKTGEILLQKGIEEKKQANFTLDSFSIYEDKLWFIGEKYQKCKFGYINLQTDELELFQEFPQENDEVFEAPVYHNGRLYIRGKHYNNLYVFE